jgi:hypothetical protein
MATEAQILPNRPNAQKSTMNTTSLAAIERVIWICSFMQNKPNLVRRRRIANECKYLFTKDL